MNKARIVLVNILIACIFYSAVGQSVSSKAFKTLNVANGLPQSFVSGLIQDSTGFIWIGTRDGLARYDGREFKLFRHTPGDTASLSDNIITNLYLDREGRLWVYFEAGDIDVLNTSTEVVFHFTKDPLYKSVYSALNRGQAFAEDARGNIWLMNSNKGVFICNLSKHSLVYYPVEKIGIPSNKIAAINSDNQHIILVTDKALAILDGNQDLLKIVPYTFPEPYIENLNYTGKTIPCICRNNGDLVILDENRLIIYHPATRLFSIVQLHQTEKPLNFCITQDSKGQIFFDCRYSIYLLSPNDSLSIWKSRTENPAFGFKSMLVDRSGVLWAGGNGSGIQLFDLRLSHFRAMSYEATFQEDILKKFLNISVKEINRSFLFQMLPYRLRWVKDNIGKIWFSKAENKCVNQADVCYYENGHLIQPPWHYTDTSGSNHTHINTLALSKSGKLWGVDFFMRLVYFDTVTNAVTVYPSIGEVDTTFTFTANSLLIDGEDKFWISTYLNGLFYYNKKTNKTTHYISSNIDGALPTNQLMNIVQDRFDTNTLWIGSLGGGLIKFNKTSGKCSFFTVREGLPNNTVYAILPDNTGVLWCSSNKGIFSFNPKKDSVLRSFTSKDGLPGDEFNRYHYFALSDGRIAFGGVDGYVVFNPLTVADDTFQPNVALTNIDINNTPADFGHKGSPFGAAINSLDKIRLPYTQNFLTFDFAALEYNITEKLQYRYMLEGFNDNWINAGNDNTAVYTKIPPGHYTLKINATNTAGKWSPYIKTLAVIIDPPFWKTWWFVTLVILAMIAVIYLLIHYRISQVRKEERQKVTFEREASELKAQALRAQMNPHFIFNCLNSIKALIQEDNKQQAVIYLTTFSRLIRNQLNNAQREISLHEELETCKLYTQLEALRFGSRIVCEFEIEKGLDTYSIQVPPLILQPFIENAIWHGILPKDGGKVKVSVSAHTDYIQCVIEDDGIGREASMRNKSQTSATYQSKGMKLVQGRLNLHNIINNQGGTITLIDKKDALGNGAGTLVTVKFKKEA